MSDDNRPFVLIVEDNPQLARVMTLVLKAWPNATADTVDGAWDLIKTGPPPACILCDPHLLNDEHSLPLYERIAAERPELLPGFVWLTGGHYSDEEARALGATGRTQIVKPISNTDLRALVTRLCAR